LPSDINLSTGTAKGRFETSPELAGIALTEVLYNIHCDNNPDKQYRNALDVLLIEAYSTPEGRNIFEKFLENNSVLMQNETLKSALYDKLGVKGDTAISVFSNDNNVDIKKFRDIENVAEKTEKSGSSLKTSVEILRAGFFFETSVETGIRDKYLETLEKDENEKPEFMTENNLEF